MTILRKYGYVILGVLCILALGGLYISTNRRPSGVMTLGQPITNLQADGPQAPATEPEPEPEPTPAPPQEPTMIGVHIVGAVNAPGFIQVPYGSRVYDVLQLAGGETYEADLELINLAAFVHDGIQIRIPAIGDEPQEIAGPPGQPAQAAAAADGRVNINLASLTELQTLPGIGPVIAQNIIDFREANNGFNSVDDLLNVPRIGPATLENIRNNVTVE